MKLLMLFEAQILLFGWASLKPVVAGSPYGATNTERLWE
jgi:hypothetical protein